MNILEYKGYRAIIEFDAENYRLKGTVMRISEGIHFYSDNLITIEEEFHKAIDEYLKRCKEKGIKPEKEYKGSFNIRINPELHAQMAMLAYKNGISLNATVEKAIERYVKENI